ncbi:MAG: GAF domain-containing protein [Candidatus Marinimicrobia bacterium]|nr:GAF domain-containing protein [Candidatus Neomarinimicrobiota bacterium]|tara:strand:+ start:433 stop:903 length:471 start_codon:yes stop_codon:yes gene_type:complete
MKNKNYPIIYKTLLSIFNTSFSLSVQAKMSLTASILGSRFSNWNFCGFYILVGKKFLEIGPYYGKIIPCTYIKFGRGVCGTAAKLEKTIIVDDVLKFHNYISCDSETKSEIVVPIFNNNNLEAVLDIDSVKMGDFNRTDKINLEKICQLFYNKNKT